MDCFRHPGEEAVVYCKGCGKPLCYDCAEQSIDGQTHVCSEACAEIARLHPDTSDQPDSAVVRFFAEAYLSIMVVLVGGILGGLFCAFGAQMAIDQIKHPRPLQYHYDLYDYHHRGFSTFRIFYDLGITNWPAEFGIGALFGIGVAVVYLKWGGKVTALACGALTLILQLWAMGK